MSSFNNRTVGPAGVAASHRGARTTIVEQAEAILRQPVGEVPEVSVSDEVIPGRSKHPNWVAYEEVPIFHPVIADQLSRIFALASEEMSRAADFPTRLPGISPFDTPRTPVVARRGHVSAQGLLSHRQSYLKALLVHSRGNVNVTPCNKCQSAYEGRSEFAHYAGCVSLPTWWGGACSNCVHDDRASSCTSRGDDNRKLSYEAFSAEFMGGAPEEGDGRGIAGAMAEETEGLVGRVTKRGRAS